MNKNDFSVIIPVYNSQTTLEELFLRIKDTFGNLNKSYEIIFIDDGSTDNSWNVLTNLKQKEPDFIVAIKLTKNYGQHNAIFCGLNFAQGQFVITIDDDLQTPPEEIKKLVSCYEQQEADLVYGYYPQKKHSFYRNVGSKFIKKSSKYLMNTAGEGSSFRLFSHDLAQKILQHQQNFVFIDELLLWYTDNIAFTEVQHLKIKTKSRYTTIKLIQLTINIIIYYTAVPLKIMTYGGLISSIISAFVGLFFLIKKIFFHITPVGYASIIVTITFSTSLILFCLGIIGEYLSRLYLMQNKKPPYTIKKVLK